MQSLSKATSWYFVGNILTRATTFLLIPLYSNIFTPEEYGNYALIMAVYAVLGVVYQAGLLQGFTRFYFEKELSTKPVVTATFNTLFLIGLGLFLLLNIFVKPVGSLFSLSNEVIPLLRIVFALLLIDNLAYFGLHFLRTRQLVKRAVIYSFGTAVTNILLNAVLLIVFRLGIMGVLLAQAGANLLLLTLILFNLKDYYSLEFDSRLAKRLVQFSIPLVLAGICGILMDVADRFMLALYVDRSQVGIYSLAYKFGLIMNVFVIAFRTAYLPHFLSFKKSGMISGARKWHIFEDKEVIIQLRKSFVKLVLMMLAIFVGITALLPLLFKIRVGDYALVNELYLGSVKLVPYILIAYFFNGLAAFFSIVPYITGKSSHFLITDSIGLGVNIVANIVLIPIYGAKGAALATMLGFFTATLYIFRIFVREINRYRS